MRTREKQVGVAKIRKVNAMQEYLELHFNDDGVLASDGRVLSPTIVTPTIGPEKLVGQMRGWSSYFRGTISNILQELSKEGWEYCGSWGHNNDRIILRRKVG
jgi:hypothetical protein